MDEITLKEEKKEKKEKRKEETDPCLYPELTNDTSIHITQGNSVDGYVAILFGIHHMQQLGYPCALTIAVIDHHYAVVCTHDDVIKVVTIDITNLKGSNG